jgi:TRAP-type C4-dicarboxylate transport system permease small subunit
MSVQPPIKDTTINMSALLLGVGVVILIIIVVAILIAVFTRR